MFKSEICKIFDIQYPIFQGGMAWVADYKLASAVSEAGGLGIIGSGNAPAEWVRDQVKRCKELTDKPFGVNIMLLNEHAEDIAKLVCELGVSVVTTGAGNPGKYMDMWKAAGIKVVPVVASVALAKRMERAGVDAVVAEGCEAGGHIGELTTMCLIPQIVDAVNIPVIAAGGIGDGRGVAATFALGAEGIQVGTRFLVSDECNIHENYKEKVISSKDIDSVVTGRFTGHPVRVIKNKLSRKMVEMEKNKISIDEFYEMGKGALRNIVVDGDVDNGSIMAGQIAGLIKKRQSCKEIIEELFQEAENVIKGVK